MNKKILSLSLSLLILNGCKVGPNYHPPENHVPNEWIVPQEVIEISVSDDPPPTCWWEIFNDPLLSNYMLMAVDCNKDVLTAESNIFQARAARQVAVAPLFPQVSVDYNAFHIFLSKNGPVDAISGMMPPSANAKPLAKFNIFNGLIDASWELDLFGKTRRNIEMYQDQLESVIEKRNDLLISVFAEIASNYIELRSAQQQQKLLEENITILKKNVEINEQRHAGGYSNLIELEQISIQLNQAVSLLPSVKIAIYRSIFSISVLTGALPEKLLEELFPIQPLPEISDCLATGLRSELLRRRPDIREAERNLAAATANIGVAVASFYPTITLTGILGLDSLKIGNLFTPNSKTWIYGADISMPVFQGGKLTGNLYIAEAQAAALGFTYQQTVLNALKEAETVLVSYMEDVKGEIELKKIVDSNEKLEALNYQRYSKGLVNQLEYLNSELILNNSILSLLQSRTTVLLDVVNLYKALGGGWEPFSVCN